MAQLAQFHVPNDAILRELGRLQVLHSQLDHSLRLAIKRTLGISIDDLSYWTEAKGMSAELRKTLRKRIDEKFADDEDKADILNKVLDDAEEVTSHRNRALHSVWIKKPDGTVRLHDRDTSIKMHKEYLPPKVAELQSLAKRMARIQRVLDHLIPPL